MVDFFPWAMLAGSNLLEARNYHNLPSSSMYPGNTGDYFACLFWKKRRYPMTMAESYDVWGDQTFPILHRRLPLLHTSCNLSFLLEPFPYLFLPCPSLPAPFPKFECFKP